MGLGRAIKQGMGGGEVRTGGGDRWWKPGPAPIGYAIGPPIPEPAVPDINVGLLKRLCETPGVPGREERVRALIEKEVKGLFDSVTTDPMGSLICRRGPRGA